MIFLKRRRLIFWLIKAYAKRWRKTILISFVLGLGVFFLLRFFITYFSPLIPFSNVQKVGIVGAYSVDNLPSEIVSKASEGLTMVDSDGTIKPAIAKNWQIENNGKTYIFYLNNNIYFTDGTKLTSDLIKYNFLDVTIERPNQYTIIFKLKNVYSPFLVTVSRPIYKNNSIGVGLYKIRSIKLNGDFVQNISFSSLKDKKEISYQFYPTEEALKNAFMLGEVSNIMKIKDITYRNIPIANFPNVQIEKKIDYSSLVTLFYNSLDKDLSDKRLREALSYTIPDTFENGQRNYGPFNPNSWVSKDGLATYHQDFEHAKLLLNQSRNASQSSELTIELKTLPKFLSIAKEIQKLWGKIGINTKIVEVDSLPTSFQAFLGEFNLPKDPDQYLIWHSGQANNITNYKNLRIDKLLEDGRQTINTSERKRIYTDFQKYLLDDPPAAFLYFPYVYDVTRK